MGEWTQGPWTIRRSITGYVDQIVGPDGQAICYGCIDEGPANLIAAAPELAKALSVIVDYLGSTAECGYDPFAAEPLIGSARAALAKAGVK